MCFTIMPKSKKIYIECHENIYILFDIKENGLHELTIDSYHLIMNEILHKKNFDMKDVNIYNKLKIYQSMVTNKELSKNYAIYMDNIHILLNNE
jgi:hypothetical protein